MTTRHDPALGEVLAAALIETERRVDGPRAELDALRSARDRAFSAPPVEWIAVRVRGLQALIERHNDRSAEALRGLLGPARLDPVVPEPGRPYDRALTTIDELTRIEPLDIGDPDSNGSG